MTVLGTLLLAVVLVAALVGAAAWAGAARAARVIAVPDAGRVTVSTDGTTAAGDADAGRVTLSERELSDRDAATGRERGLIRTGQWATGLACAATMGAVAIVETALIVDDTRLDFVAMVSGPELPVYYRVTALWSALEGSLLLWLLILALVAVLAVSRANSATSVRARGIVGLVMSVATAAFAVVTLMASPFAIDDAAVASRPSPLLQDHVAMGIHPPLLYAGFLGLAVPYALAIAGLATRQMDAAWASRVRRWTLVSWMLLTAGIMLGAWWSYAVLGWGGYWAWDPVENASLLPWLTATALLHSVAPRTRTGAWRLWAAGLAGASFVLVLLATFLTRSGFVQSIHAFTTSPLGPALLVIVLAALVPWVVLMHRRRRELAQTPTAPLASRASALQANRVLLVLITLVVLVGTTLPSILLGITGERLSVGPPWYHRTLAPLALVLLVLMAVGPWLPARGGSARTLAQRIRVPALAGALTLGAAALAFAEVWLAVSAGIAVFALASLALTAADRRRRDRLAIGAWIAHAGIAIGAVAVLGGGLGTVTQQSVPVGGTVTAGDTTVTVIGLDGRDEGRRHVAAAQVALGEGQDFVTVVEPELRWYEAENTMLAGPQIRSEPLRDVYVTLLDVDEENGLVTIRLAVNPLVSWLWAATVIVIVGAAVAGWPRRRRPRVSLPANTGASESTGLGSTALESTTRPRRAVQPVATAPAASALTGPAPVQRAGHARTRGSEA